MTVVENLNLQLAEIAAEMRESKMEFPESRSAALVAAAKVRAER